MKLGGKNLETSKGYHLKVLETSVNQPFLQNYYFHVQILKSRGKIYSKKFETSEGYLLPNLAILIIPRFVRGKLT